MVGSRIKQYFAIGGRNLEVELTPDLAEVYLYCGDNTLRLVRRVPRRDLPADHASATDLLLKPLRDRLINRPMSREDLAWAMRRHLLARMGIKVRSEDVYLVPKDKRRAILCSGARALDLITMWRVQRHIQTPKPHPELLGLRSWSFNGQVLVSPTRHTPWTTSVLQAHALDESSVVEGRSGIHALHAPHVPSLQQTLCAGRCILAERICLDQVWGLVRPYGRTVIGPNGWRAEFAEIIALMTAKPSYLTVLSERYQVPCFLFEDI